MNVWNLPSQHDATPDCGPILFVLSAEGKIRWISENLQAFCGLDPVQAIGVSLLELVSFDTDDVEVASSTTIRRAHLCTPDGARRAVLVVEPSNPGLPSVGAIAASGHIRHFSLVHALAGQALLWRVNLKTLQASGFGQLQDFKMSEYGDSGASAAWMAQVHPDDIQIYQAELAAIAHGHSTTVDLEVRVKRRDGRWLWTLTRGEVSLRDDTGFPVELSGFTIENAKQKQSEFELQGHRAMLRRSLRLARVAAWAYDAEKSEQIWTDEASELLSVPSGYVPDNLLGLELFDGESQVRVNKAVTRALNEGIGFDQELLRITPQGRVLWIRAVANPEFEDGVMVRLSGLFQDITRQRRMEQAVRDSERLLKQLTAGLPDAIFQLRRTPDGQFHLDFLSEGIRRMLQITSRDGLPDFQGLMAAIEPQSKLLFLRNLDRAASQRELFNQELSVAQHGGPNLTVLGRAQPEPQLDGSCLYFGFLSDITDQKRHDMALREAEQTQQRLTRLEAVGQLAGGIAHDFNNYLTSIVMSLSLLEAQTELSNDAIQLVREALTATSSAQALTRQLLTFSRGASPVKQLVDTESLVREAVNFTLRGSAVQCHIEATPGIWAIDVDTGQIQQVLQNLVLNAAQAMNNQGHLWIHLRNVPGNTEIPGLPRGPIVCIELTDEGPGIPDAIREKLFQPYVTSKPEGSGLGLASAFSVVRRHDGMINYEPASTGGARFSVWLPATPKQIAVSNVEVQPPVAGSGTVLVMDDNEGILKMIRRALEHLGFEALTAHNGIEALEILEHCKQRGIPLRAVILDQTIPGGIGGADALKLLRANEPNLVAIATSGYTEGETMANFAEFGFAGILRKPFRMQDLARVLSDVLAPEHPQNL